jgi:hypothetical protein
VKSRRNIIYAFRRLIFYKRGTPPDPRYEKACDPRYEKACDPRYEKACDPRTKAPHKNPAQKPHHPAMQTLDVLFKHSSPDLI